MILDIGRVCIKIAGREAGNIAIIVDKEDTKHVLIDGNVKRKRCNISHLEPTDLSLKIKKGASHASVINAMKKEKLEVKPSTTKKPKKEKPKKQRKQKQPSTEPKILQKKAKENKKTKKETKVTKKTTKNKTKKTASTKKKQTNKTKK